jgi:hypothetical protein
MNVHSRPNSEKEIPGEPADAEAPEDEQSLPLIVATSVLFVAVVVVFIILIVTEKSAQVAQAAAAAQAAANVPATKGPTVSQQNVDSPGISSDQVINETAEYETQYDDVNNNEQGGETYEENNQMNWQEPQEGTPVFFL